MKAVNLTRTGKPSVLTVTDLPEPLPKKGEVRVNLEYAGINFAEILSRKGLYGWAPKRPYILGMEGSGTIDKTGEGVDATLVGKKVVVGAQYGCYSQKICVPASQAVPALDHLSMEENAALLVNYATAWVSLMELGRLQKGERVLITAAAGGVGTAAIQLATAMECKVYGLAGSDEKIKLIKSLGAQGGFNYRDAAWHQAMRNTVGKTDLVLEMVGGDVYKRCYESLDYFGRIVVVGYASLDIKLWNPMSWWRAWRGIPRMDIMDAAERSVAVMSSHLGYLLPDQVKMQEIVGRMYAFISGKNIKPVIGEIFTLENVQQAHVLVESRRSTGKVLLKIPQD